MKKVTALVLVILFTVCVTSAFAQKSIQTMGSEKRPLSKSITDGTFQAASDHIAQWGKSRPMAKESSLRGNKEELARRRGM